MSNPTDRIADGDATGDMFVTSPGDKYHEEFLQGERLKSEWPSHIDETAKDISQGISIGNTTLTSQDFGYELGEYYKRGIIQTTGEHSDIPEILDEGLTDDDLGTLVYQINKLTLQIQNADSIEIQKPETAIEAVIEKILTRKLTGESNASVSISGATAAEITTQMLTHPTVTDNIDELIESFESHVKNGLIELLETPQMTTALWDHQREALQEWCKNEYTGFVDMATATGKTVLGLAAIAHKYGDLHPKDKWIDEFQPDTQTREDVLIVAHNELILEQWRREFEAYLNIPKEIITGDSIISFGWGDVHFRTAQSLVNNDVTPYDLVLLDEAHHYANSPEWGTLLNEFNSDVLALSGSVDELKTDDTQIKDRLRNTVGEELIQYTIKDAEREGVIPSFDWEIRFAPYNITDAQLQATTKRCEEKFNEFTAQLDSGEIDISTELLTYDAVRAFSHSTEGKQLKQDNDTFRELVTRLFSRRAKQWNLSPAFDAIIELVMNHYMNEKVVVLTDSNAQVEALESRLNSVGTPSSVYVVSNTHSQVEQRDVIDSFDTPETTGVLIGTGDLLGEGVDMQHASVAINMATGGVNKQLVQRIGRVLRNPSDTDKHAMFYNVVGTPPEPETAVHREDGKQLIEQAAQFCALGRKFDKLPGFAVSTTTQDAVLQNMLSEGSSFIHDCISHDTYDWGNTAIEENDIVELTDAVNRNTDSIETILGEWEDYSLAQDTSGTSRDTPIGGSEQIDWDVESLAAATTLTKHVVKHHIEHMASELNECSREKAVLYVQWYLRDMLRGKGLFAVNGIQPNTGRKLVEAGVTTTESLFNTDTGIITSKTNISKETVTTLQQAAEAGNYNSYATGSDRVADALLESTPESEVTPDATGNPSSTETNSKNTSEPSNNVDKDTTSETTNSSSGENQYTDSSNQSTTSSSQVDLDDFIN